VGLSVGRRSEPTKGRQPSPGSGHRGGRTTSLTFRPQPVTLEALLSGLVDPPCSRIGALVPNDFLSKSQRKTLASALNNLMASPTFQSWLQGSTLDVGKWLTPKDGRTPAVVVSVAHLDDDERELAQSVP
jgi:hypothetical protein